MNALAGSDHWSSGRLCLQPKQIAESAGGVDHNFRGGAKFVAGFDIACFDAVDKSLGVLRQAPDFDVVQQRCALLERCDHHVDEQPGVVKLTVVINCPATQAFSLQCWQMFKRLFFGKNAGDAKAVFSGQQLIELQSETVEWSLPPIVVRHDERQIVHDVGRVLQKQSALLERFHDEANIALLQVTHPSVCQLGAATGGALAEVALLEQQHIVAARSGIDCYAYAGSAAAHNDHVPCLGMNFDATPHVGSIHSCTLCSGEPGETSAPLPTAIPPNQTNASPLFSKSDKAARGIPDPFSAPTVDRLPSWRRVRRYHGRSRLPARRRMQRREPWSPSPSDEPPASPKCRTGIASADRSRPFHRRRAARRA